MRRLFVLLAAAASLGFAGEAAAEPVVLADDQGRSLTFDVRAEGVDVEWYAALLRAAPHGDEISAVQVHVVSFEEMARTCGREAAGCYGRNTITIPASETDDNAQTLLHEYGHHLDRSLPVAGAGEPNGTSTWWRARGMQRLLLQGSVYRSYVRGWDRSVAEIFAEDYARLARPEGSFSIRWLDEPTETILAAILFDLGHGPEPTIVPPPALRPVSIARRGTLAPGASATIPFGLLGPGRRVQATATLAGAAAKGVRGRLELRCDGGRIVVRSIASGRTSVTLDRRNLGPAEECTATLTSTGRARRAYTLAVRLSIPGA